MIRKLSGMMISCFIIVNVYLSATIIETSHFYEIIQHVTADTLVILDIDDTLLVPVQTLGSDVWFQYRVQEYKKRDFSHQEALERALAEWEGVRHITKMKIVEERTDEVVAYLQRKKYVVMGLTTQGLALATRTVQQLLSARINLIKTAPSQDDHYFINRLGVLYHKGLLFTAGTAKGAALLKFFDLINFHPKHIVFINDKETHLRDVQEAVEAKGILFTGLRYSYSDKRVANFSSDIAEMQWAYSTFDEILSDEEAGSLCK